MTSLLKHYREHVEMLRAAGARLTEYPCPHCGELIATPIPGDEVNFNTLSTCPHCEEEHIKLFHCDGSVTAEEV